MVRGDQSLANVIESFHSIIGGERDCGIEVDHLQAKQIADRVAILLTVEPTKHNLARVFLCRLARAGQ